MDGVVGTNGGRYQEFRIDDPVFTVENIVTSDGIHVVNQDLRVDLIARNTEITTLISEDNLVPGLSPLRRPIKSLIDPPIEAERACSDDSAKREVLESFFEGLEPFEL